MSELVSASEGFSGAELEEAVVSGLYAAFYHKRDLTAEDVLKAIKNTNPLAKSRGAELQEMVKWAAENAVNASRVEDKEKASETTTGGRQLDLE